MYRNNKQVEDRLFRVKQEDEYSDLMVIKTGVPQGCVPGSVLYFLYTNGLPKLQESVIPTFADYTALLTSHGLQLHQYLENQSQQDKGNAHSFHQQKH